MEARPKYKHWGLGPQYDARIGNKHCQTVETSSLCEAKGWETTHMRVIEAKIPLPLYAILQIET